MAAQTTLKPNEWYGWDPQKHTLTAEKECTFGTTNVYLVHDNGEPLGWVFSRPGSTFSKRREWDFTTMRDGWATTKNLYPYQSRHDAAVYLLESTESADFTGSAESGEGA